MNYAVEVYKLSAHLPGAERDNLTQQTRKAATSVPLNIAEGAGCGSGGEFARFLGYAYRSLKEVVTCLELCRRLYAWLPAESVTRLIEEGEQIARMTRTLMRRLKENPNPRTLNPEPWTQNPEPRLKTQN
jgi:four helix bundle protein